MENCRFNNVELSIFAKFLHYACNADINIRDYINEINKPSTSDRRNNPIIADTNPNVSRINREQFHQP